jgi:proteasome accessory factor A
LTGAGKAGSEKGEFVPFQISQRADFFVEPYNAETLFRRPIFNTRDEPHADPRRWIRLHVISGDANMMASCTARKAGLVKLALMLEMAQESPVWRLSRPVQAFSAISRAPDGEGRIDLEGGSWTTPRQILESYLDAAEKVFDLEPELHDLVQECRHLLDLRFQNHEAFARSVDWAAKRSLLEQFRDSEGLAWSDQAMQSLDLAYCDLDPDNGLFPALCASGLADEQPDQHALEARLAAPCEPTRALARAAAVQRLRSEVQSISWSSVRFRSQSEEVVLDPTLIYPESLLSIGSVEEFVAAVASAEPLAS